jgi:hypothetical protein
MNTADTLRKSLVANYQEYGEGRIAEGAPEAILHAKMR